MQEQKQQPILIIDDDVSLRRVMELTLTAAGYPVMSAADCQSGLELFKSQRPQLVVTDVQMPDNSGYEVLRQVKKESPQTIVIVITAFGTIEKAVRAMREGAYDYVTKPFSRDELVSIIERALQFQHRSRTVTPIKKDTDNSKIVGRSPAINDVKRLVSKIAQSNSTVLITGESGAGKEVVAKELHRQSPLANKPFVAVNCAAIPPELIESELFGHIKGAFTGAIQNRSGKFEQADGGTIFLDEIGELPLPLQAKLLRVLQEKEIEPVGGTSKKINVRVIAATNRDLEQEIAALNFREDLFYRLAVITLELPPLRKRKEDIEIFVSHFISSKSTQPVTISAETLTALKNYSWPGNVRELENCIERMLVLRQGDQLEIADLPPKIQKGSSTNPVDLPQPEQGYSLPQLEKRAVIDALERTNWNQTKAAQFLKIPRHVLIYRMDKYAIPKKKPESR